MHADAGAAGEQELAGLDELFAAGGSGSRLQELHELRSVLRSLCMIGAYNASLVHAQRPGARFVASRTAWRSRYGRRLRPGARPVVILRPFGPVDLIYDVADTKGPPLPEGLREAYRVRGLLRPDAAEVMVGLLARAGAEIAVPPTVAGSGSEEHADDQSAARLAAVLRAGGRALCDRATGTPAGLMTGNLAPQQAQVREAEAACVAWLLAARTGIELPDVEPVAVGGPGETKDLPPISLHAVVSAVGRIESAAGGLEELSRMLSASPGAREERPTAGQAPPVDPRQGVLDLGEESAGPAAADQTDSTSPVTSTPVTFQSPPSTIR